MTKQEISKLFEIPISTLNDWQKENSNRHKLYQFLNQFDVRNTTKILAEKKNHRIFHILNRNIDKAEAFSVTDIKVAFSHDNYTNASEKEHIIYSKFFKECDEEDLTNLIKQFNLSIRNIKKIYLTSPLRKLKGVADIWDKRFRLQPLEVSIQSSNDTSIPIALQQILAKRGLNV